VKTQTHTHTHTHTHTLAHTYIHIFIIVFQIRLYSYCSLSVCKEHRFIVDTVAPFPNHVDHTVKQALKMLWLIRYVTCYSFIVDCRVIVHCAVAL